VNREGGRLGRPKRPRGRGSVACFERASRRAMALAGLSLEEAAALSALKADLAATPGDAAGRAWLVGGAGEWTYVRFLRGHKLQVAKAARLLRACAAWRQEYGADAILESWPKEHSKEAELCRRFWPLGLTGRSQGLNGRPVHFFHLSQCDFPALLKHVSLDVLVRYNVFLLEKALQFEPQGGAVMLVDLGGAEDGSAALSLRTVTQWFSSLVLFMKAMALVADHHYPETYSAVYFCRLNKVLEATFNSAKSTVPEATLAKIVLLSKADIPGKLLDAGLSIESIPPSLQGSSPRHVAPGGMITDQAVAAAHAEAARLQAEAAAKAGQPRKSLSKRLSQALLGKP
jgi:hypothetical protein